MLPCRYRAACHSARFERAALGKTTIPPLPSQDRHKYLQRVAELLYQQGELAVNEAEYQAMELVVAEAAALEPHMTPQQAAELTVAYARLKANHITLDQCYRSRQRIQAQRAWAADHVRQNRTGAIDHAFVLRWPRLVCRNSEYSLGLARKLCVPVTRITGKLLRHGRSYSHCSHNGWGTPCAATRPNEDNIR
jgi:hypothetical protein